MEKLKLDFVDVGLTRAPHRDNAISQKGIQLHGDIQNDRGCCLGYLFLYIPIRQQLCKPTNLVSKCSIVGMVIPAIGAARSPMKTTLEPVNVKTTLNGTIYKGRLQSLDWTGLDWTGLKNLMNDLSSSHRGAFPLLRSWLPDAVASSSSAQHRASRVSVSAKLIDPPRSKLPTHSFK